MMSKLILSLLLLVVVLALYAEGRPGRSHGRHRGGHPRFGMSDARGRRRMNGGFNPRRARRWLAR